MQPSDRLDVSAIRARFSYAAADAIRAAAGAIAADPAVRSDPPGVIDRYISAHLPGVQTPEQRTITEHAIALALLDHLGEISQFFQYQVQQYAQQRAQALATLSDLAQQIADTDQAITQNLK